MNHTFIAAVALFFCVLFGGCRRQGRIVVNIVLVGNGTAYRILQSRFAQLGLQEIRLSSGRQVIPQEVYPRADEFEKFVTTVSPVDIVVCDSPQQLANSSVLRREAGAAVNICGTAGDCPAFVPSWVPPDRLEAARRVFQALQVGLNSR